MMNRIVRAVALVAAMAGVAGTASASNDPAMDAQVMRISNDWAHIRYQVPNRDAQYNQLAALEHKAAEVVQRYPNRAEPLLWEGIVVSEEAARASVLRQLGLATRARDILTRAYAIDPKVADGGAAMSLGVLYYKVPGFPIGFGSTKRAREFFQKALALDPNGLDNNFFYGDFLYSEGEKEEAKRYLARALKAPVDPRRQVWDAGRRAEIRALIAKIDRGA